MTKREKIIYSLDCCSWGIMCSYCPYKDEPECKTILMCDTLALLKEQEARLMTLEEVETSRGFVWVEFHSINENRLSLEYVNVRATERFRDSFVLATDSGIEWLRDRGDYNRGIWFGMNSGWRCWSSRPTPEQMRETPWEENND